MASITTTGSKLILFAFFISFAAVAQASKPRVSYGGTCNNTLRCDTRAWLRCVEGKCDCMKPEEMLFEEGSGKCVAKAGERCMYAFGDGSELSNMFYEVHSCVQGASCSPDGICSCNAELYETTEGTCAVTKVHLESCSDAVKCSALKGLQCQDGKCQCDATTSEYSSVDVQCVGLAGHQCIGGKCTAHASCATNMCVCDEGHYWDVTGKCTPQIPLFGNCSADFQCKSLDSSKLKCVNGICDCDPTVSIHASVQRSHPYNYGGQYGGYEGSSYMGCVPLASFPCHKGFCAPRSYCLYNRNLQNYYPYDYSGICRCEPGLTPSRNNKCGRGHDGACESADECIDSLVCKNQKCSCELNVQLFNSTSKKCYSGVRGPCSTDENCEANAHCQLSETGYGHCTCNPGFVPNANDVCEVAEGGKCKLTSQCDSIARLECINGVCKCGTFSIFSDLLRKCVGKVGAKCKVDAANECVENAQCEETHPELPASCTCHEGFVEAGNYTCVLATIYEEPLNHQIGISSSEEEQGISAVPV